MIGTPPPLNQTALRAALMHPNGLFGRVEIVASTGSTNTDLAHSAVAPNQRWPDLSVLIADAQEAGKGRLGRAWVVPAGYAMISSVLLRPSEQAAGSAGRLTPSTPPFSPTGYPWLSVLAGVALCEALRTYASVPAQLKWPNDVVVNGRKLAGILAQLVPSPAGQPGVVVGVGVNVSAEAHQLPTDRATSLLLEGVTADLLDRNVLLPAYLNTFAALYRSFVAVAGDATAPLGDEGGSVLDLAAQHMSTLGQAVRAELPGGTMLHGLAVGLGNDGSLLLDDGGGTIHAVSAGDVIHLRRTETDGTLKYA